MKQMCIRVIPDIKLVLKFCLLITPSDKKRDFVLRQQIRSPGISLSQLFSVYCDYLAAWIGRWNFGK